MWKVISFKEMLELENYMNTKGIVEGTNYPKIVVNVSGHYVLVYFVP